MADKPRKRKKKPIALDAIWQNAQWIPALANAQGVSLDPPPPAPLTPQHPRPHHPTSGTRERA